MGRTASPGKQVLKDACEERNISSNGSIKQILHRLERFDEKQKLQKFSTHSNTIAKSGKIAKNTKKTKCTQNGKNAYTVAKTKAKQDEKKGMKYASMSTPIKPLQMSAQFYVETHCNNDLNKACPEYVYGSDGKTVKLRIPKVCGSKAGKIIRWVISK